jgi:diacylglycerol kinase
VAVFVVGVGLVVGLRPAEWAFLVAMIALVGALELVNTVVEVVVDLVSPEYHPLAKIAKDVAAGAVLLAAACAVVVGALILLPPLGTALFRR